MLWQAKSSAPVRPKITTSTPSLYQTSRDNGLPSPTDSFSKSPPRSYERNTPADLTPPPDNHTRPACAFHQPIDGPLEKSYTVEQKCRFKIPLNTEDFSVLKTLGTGTFARVCLVKPTKTEEPNKVYALKILRKSEVIRLKQIDHIISERSILNSVSGHPFITRLYGTFSDADRIFLLLDYIPGGELFSYLRRYRSFHEHEARFYASEIVLVLQHLHETQDGIAYRDLKPENILLDSTGHIKLVDFGFAKKLGGVHSGSNQPVPLSPTALEEKKQRSLAAKMAYIGDAWARAPSPEPEIYSQYARETYTLCGTPEYLAPEVIRATGHTGAVDWWALGILIYEMIIGRPPFWDSSPLIIYDDILHKDITFPDRPISKEAKDLILSLCQRDVTQRLGNTVGGAEGVKQHKWFADVDWNKVYLKQEEPPFIPRVSHAEDTSCFDVYPEEDVDAGEYTAEMAEKYEEVFADF